jgi:AbiU2
MEGSCEQFGEEQATAAQRDLQAAITDARAILKSECLAGIMNFRHKSLAHSLSQTYRERVAPVAPMKSSDAREILTRSCKIVEVLYRVVNGKSFSFDDSRGMHRENAESLWAGCKFNIAR